MAKILCVAAPGRDRCPSPSTRFHYELELLERGVTRIAGLDEAGRGPLAGPVVAAAVVFPADWIRRGLPEVFQELNDSKQLSAATREVLYAGLVSNKEAGRS